jgi:hypothetical protein
MESSARRSLTRVAPLAVLALPLIALAVLFGAPKSGAQLPGPTMLTSGNVTFVKNLAEASDGVGARVVGNRLFVTTTKDLVVYDISEPLDPKRLGAINVAVEFENEEVPTNGKLLGISGEIGGCVVPGLAPVPDDNCLIIYDVSKAEAPRAVKIVPDAGDHTATCILDCQYFYGSEGTIVDARDPANAKIVGNWSDDLKFTRSGRCHHQNEIRPGIIVAACQPMYMLSVRPEDGGSILKPKVLAQYSHADNRFIHGLRWPNAGSDRFLLGGGETNAQPRCTDKVGAFMVFDGTRPSDRGTWTQTDERRPQNGTYQDDPVAGANPPTQILGCSAHWFEEHPTFRNGGLVALAEYEQGTRFLQITPEGKIRQLGYALPIGGSTSAPHWAPDGRTVYAIDYTRGLDVLRYEGPLVVPDEAGNVERPPQATAPGERELSEAGAAQTAQPSSAGSTSSSAAAAGCASAAGFDRVAVRGSRVLVDRRQQRPYSFSLFRQSAGSRVVPNRLVTRMRRSTRSRFSLPSRGVGDGVYLARVTMDLPGVDDVRRVVLRRSGGRWSVRPDAYSRAACSLVSAFKLDRAVFGGRGNRALGISYRLPSGVDEVRLDVLRGSRVVKRLKAGSRGRAYRFRVPASIAPAGTDVRVRISVRRSGSTVTETLTARRL